MRPARFFEYFEYFYIILIINNLYLAKFFRLFIVGKKTLQVLNFHFGRKYHFVISKNGIFTVFSGSLSKTSA